MDDSYPRTGKRCKNEYRFKKSTNLCHRTNNTTPLASHKSRSYHRTGKRCKPTYHYNKSKKLCISKLVSPSPISYESYERLGKRCKKSYRHHTPSGLCVYTKKKRRIMNRESPLPIERQEDMLASDSPDTSQSYSSDIFESPVNNSYESPSSSDSAFYSPEDLPVKNVPKKRSKLNLLQNMGINL